jgi:hypothetical protein
MPRLATKGSCLSTWIIHETSYLTVIVEVLYKSRPTIVIVDSLSRLARQENQLDNLGFPLMLETLLCPSTVRNALSIRVNAGKDTIIVSRIRQRWRKPSNQINNTVGSVSDKIDFLISALCRQSTTKGS